MTISRLPAGTEYRITEEPAEGYQTGYEVNGRETAEPPAGTLGPDQREQIRTVNVWPEVPETGDPFREHAGCPPGRPGAVPGGGCWGFWGSCKEKNGSPGGMK